MTDTEFDFSLADVEYELWALQEHFDALESQIAFLKDQGRIQTQARILEGGQNQDPVEVQAEWDVHRERTDRILPRLFRGSYLVVLWAVFESSVLEIAALLRLDQVRAPKLEAKPFKTFIPRLVKHFQQHFAPTFSVAQDTLDKMEDFLEVRNAFAHANGRVEAVSRMPRINSLIAKAQGISDDDGYLLPSADFCQRSYIAAKSVVESLCQLYRQHAQARGRSA